MKGASSFIGINFASNPDQIRFNILDDFTVKTVFASIYFIIFSLGILANVVVAFVSIDQLFKHLKLHHRGILTRKESTFAVTNVFILTLVVADILLCLSSSLLTPISFFTKNWPFGEIGCRILPAITISSVCIVSLTSTVIAIDRFFAICYPYVLRPNIYKAIGTTILLWIFCILISSPVIAFSSVESNDGDRNFTKCFETWPTSEIGKIYSFFLVIIQFGTPGLIICICYIIIGRKLKERKAGRLVKRLVSSTLNGKRTRRALPRQVSLGEQNKMSRSLKTVILMVLTFWSCWLPINCVIIADGLTSYNLWLTSWYPTLYYIFHLIAMSSSIWNPLFYAWMNNNFRKLIRKPPVEKGRAMEKPLRRLHKQIMVVVQRLFSAEFSNNLDRNLKKETSQNSRFNKISNNLSITVKYSQLRSSSLSTTHSEICALGQSEEDESASSSSRSSRSNSSASQSSEVVDRFVSSLAPRASLASL